MSLWSFVLEEIIGIFFFSSRRRHTRYIGDWSSDVCSSDLSPVVTVDDGREQAQEEAALIVVQEDRRSRYSPRCDVVNPERGELVSRATHGANVAAAQPQATSQRTARGQTAALLSHQAWPLQPTRRDSPWWERWWRRRAQPARRSTRR